MGKRRKAVKRKKMKKRKKKALKRKPARKARGKKRRRRKKKVSIKLAGSSKSRGRKPASPDASESGIEKRQSFKAVLIKVGHQAGADRAVKNLVLMFNVSPDERKANYLHARRELTHRAGGDFGHFNGSQFGGFDKVFLAAQLS